MAANTVPLREELADIANLHYVDGPPMHSAGGSRPWWILGRKLEHDLSNTRWQETVSTFFFLSRGIVYVNILLVAASIGAVVVG